MIKPKKAFTIIELLVVIAIIGILATVSILALSNARSKARDAKRAGDAKQVQTALELFFNDKGRYPTAEEWGSGQIFSTSTGATSTYMQIIPSAPTPADGSCSNTQNALYYQQTENGASYTLSYCLGGNTGQLAAGLKCLTPGGVLESDCSASSHASSFQTSFDYLSSASNAAGTIGYGSGSYSADNNQHAIQVYAYKEIGGQYYVSDPSSIDMVDNGSNSDYYIDWSWTASPEADGYVVIKQNNTASNVIASCQTVEAAFQEVTSMNQRTNELLNYVINGMVTLGDIDSIAVEAGQLEISKVEALNYSLGFVYNLPASVATDINNLISAEAPIKTQIDNMAAATTVASAQSYANTAKGLLTDFMADVESVRMAMGELQGTAEVEASQRYYQVVSGTSIHDTTSSVWQIGEPSLFGFWFSASGMNHYINIYYYTNNGGTKTFSDYFSEANLTDDSSGRPYDISLNWDLGGNDGIRLLWSMDGNDWYYQDIEGVSTIRFSQLTNFQSGSNPPTN